VEEPDEELAPQLEPLQMDWDTLAADRATTISGEKADNRWRCSSSKPREGDRVFLIRTGSPPKGVVAVGKVTRAPYEAEHWEQARADAGETTRFVDVAFDSVRDATTDEIVPLEELQSREPRPRMEPAVFRDRDQGKGGAEPGAPMEGAVHLSHRAPLRRGTTPELEMHLQRNSRRP
jgi:hypothetical protein